MYAVEIRIFHLLFVCYIEMDALKNKNKMRNATTTTYPTFQVINRRKKKRKENF